MIRKGSKRGFRQLLIDMKPGNTLHIDTSQASRHDVFQMARQIERETNMIFRVSLQRGNTTTITKRR